MREFDRIREKIQENLLQPSLIAVPNIGACTPGSTIRSRRYLRGCDTAKFTQMRVAGHEPRGQFRATYLAS
ncbi:MAG: hypothetical protein ABIU86_05465, partial [Gemmatimonadaceae bacterium]